MAGIDNDLAVIADVKRVLLDLIDIYKNGVSLASFQDVVDAVKAVSDLSSRIPAAALENQDLDAKEMAQLLSESFSLVKELVAALKQVVIPPAA